MSIPSLCKALSSSLCDNLRQTASKEESLALASQALRHAADDIMPLLETLRAERGEGHHEYRQAQHAVLELLSFVCIPFIRSSTSYSATMNGLEALAAKCHDAVIKEKLVTYAVQVRKMWDHAEPGGIHHVPQPARRLVLQRHKRHLRLAWSVFSAVAVVLFAASLIRYDLTSAIVPRLNSSRSHERKVAPANAPAEEQIAAAGRVATALNSGMPSIKRGNFCRYTDDQGIVHVVNDATKVPERYRLNMEMTPAEDNAVTKIICSSNHVLVPVTLKYRGREAQAVLLLDTGASTTTIDETVASRLHVDIDAATIITATVADGRSVPTYAFSSDSVSVATHTVPGAAVTILPGCGGNGAEGLLGMNFLKEFRYHIDYKRGLIEWGS